MNTSCQIISGGVQGNRLAMHRVTQEKTKKRQAGFTLLEVLLAVGLAAMVIVVALVTLHHTSSVRARLDILSEVNGNGRYVLDRLRDDWANIYRNSPSEPVLFIATDGSSGTGVTRLLFRTVQSHFFNDNEATGDICEVEYILAPSLDDKSCFTLTRRCTALNDIGRVNAGSINVILAKNVTELSFEFFDGSDWRSYWDAIDQLPLSGRVHFVLTDTKSGLSLEFSQTVAFCAISPTLSDSQNTINAALSQDN
ncbi:MAG: prepilin-type N-terminal cleavage/methylation domain-containing protein [Sedimentisphaerales bacterium]|nr:prepilin-type N-terminal cleavage/methylation domain-containing protein [Sedimentisphaerales bacterium]